MPLSQRAPDLMLRRILRISLLQRSSSERRTATQTPCARSVWTSCSVSRDSQMLLAVGEFHFSERLAALAGEESDVFMDALEDALRSAHDDEFVAVGGFFIGLSEMNSGNDVAASSFFCAALRPASPVPQRRPRASSQRLNADESGPHPLVPVRRTLR